MARTALLRRLAATALLGMALFAPSSPARADGCAIPAFERGEVEMSDQRAIIHFDGTTETLAIDTGIRTDGQQGDYAWVVPLPAVPESVEPVSAGVFPTVESLCAPEVQVRRDTAAWPFAVGLGVFMLVLLMLLKHLQGKTPAWVTVTVVCGLFVILAAVLLPALGAARRLARGGGDDGVEIHQHEILGAYDTAVLSSPDGQALNDWLAKHNYKVPAKAGPVIAQLAKEGWSFVAMRLVPGAAVRPHPMAFRFQTKEAIYPMRLTGAAQTNPLKVDLFVFGDRAAAADGFRNWAQLECTRPTDEDIRDHTEEAQPFRPRKFWMPIAHPALRRLVPQAHQFTWLRGEVPLAAMDRDIQVDWKAPKPHRTFFVTAEVARGVAVDRAVPCFVLAIIVAACFLVFGRKTAAMRTAMWGLAASMAVCLLTYASQDKQEGTGMATNDYKRSHYSIRGMLGAAMDFTPPAEANTSSSLWAAFLKHTDDSDLLQDPPPASDTPGGVLVRETDSAFELCIYDRSGMEHIAWKRNKAGKQDSAKDAAPVP